MNILFFLTPKEEVACVYEHNTLRQVLEKMEYHRYTAIPVLKRTGEYLGTLTEGDLLWAIKNVYGLDLKKAESQLIAAVPRHSDNEAIRVETDVHEMALKSMDQNFVPVVDDRGMFIGIITRKNVIRYLYKQLSRDLGTANGQAAAFAGRLAEIAQA
ncbi:MAG: CBS domain-containing protein [Peptococcaceae bacterium]|jgi:CBS domain-containing protein|nr:CBS domain-containing protein [Peptococcaceae bacterium]